MSERSERVGHPSDAAQTSTVLPSSPRSEPQLPLRRTTHATDPWTVHARRVIHDSVCRVEEHDVETPDGRLFDEARPADAARLRAEGWTRAAG